MADDSAPTLDPSVLETLRQLGEPGQPDVLQEVLTLFLGDAEMRLEAIETAVAAGDAPALQRAAHTLKGASASIGAVGLQRICREFEEMGRRSHVTEASARLGQLRSEYQRVQQAINQLL